jgi:hypothetical protein
MLEPLLPNTRDGGQPSLFALRFNTHGYLPQASPQPDQMRIWRTPDGDGLGFYFVPMPPDLPPNASSVDELAVFYRMLLEASGGKLVEISVIKVGGYPTVRTLLSVPQTPSGRTYVGALTIPFQDFSFVIKCQCLEVGITGIKEVKLAARNRFASESCQVINQHFFLSELNPDDPMYDSEFPQHPVARVRRVLAHVASSLVVAETVRALPGFALPTDS